jgi:dihydrofolate reductase
VQEAIERAREIKEEEAFVIGGAEIFAAAFSTANKLYLTEIDANVEGDIFFPKWNMPEWRETSRRHHPADDRHAFPFDFVIYERTV